MKRNLSLSVGSAIKPVLGAIFLCVGALLFWVIAGNRSPNLLRPLSMFARTGYALVAPSIYLVLYLAFRSKGWLGSLFALTLTMSVFALALAGVWAAGTTESGLLGGVIPMFNSANYYNDALRLLMGYEFSEDSTRRPLFSAFFAFLLWIAKHDLFLALTLLTLLVSIACFLLAREINQTHGPAVAVFVLVIVFVYYRYHSGVVRTENLGILFGALGTGAIWRGIAKRHALYFMAGILLTSFGMLARAGAFFILPLLVLWGAVVFRKPGKPLSWRFVGGGLLTILFTFWVNQIITKSFGASGILPFGNFSYSFYGLASGGRSWAYILEGNPQASYLDIYRMAFQLILEQPGLFIKGVLYNTSMFFSNTSYGLYSYMSGEGNAATTLSYWVLLLFSGLGIWNWFLHRDDPYLGFVMVSALGLLLSVPFLPPTDAFRLRAYATSIVILALLPAMGLSGVLTKLNMERPLSPRVADPTFESALGTFSALVLAAVVLGPFAIRAAELPPRMRDSNCDPGQTSLAMRYEPTVTVQSVPQNAILLDWAPVFHVGTLRTKVHDFPNIEFIDWFLDNIRPDRTFFFGLDTRSYRGALALIDSGSLPARPALLELCGSWEDDPGLVQFSIFYARSVYFLEFE